LRFFKSRTRLRVLVDPLLDASVSHMGRILRGLDMDVMEAHNYYDDRFDGRSQAWLLKLKQYNDRN
jgi:phosphomannomutase